MYPKLKEPAARCYSASPPRLSPKAATFVKKSEVPKHVRPTAPCSDDDDVVEVLGPFDIKDLVKQPKSLNQGTGVANRYRPLAPSRKSGIQHESRHPFFSTKFSKDVSPCSTNTLTASMQTMSVNSSLSTNFSLAQPIIPLLAPTPFTPVDHLTADEPVTKGKEKESDEASLPQPDLEYFSYRSYTPDPARVYVTNEEEANDLVSMLRGPIGFDMEWRVLYTRSKAGTKAKSCRTATVQVCDERMILVIQVHGMQRFPQALKELIESKTVVKMGANILNDGVKLFGDYGVVAHNLVELGALARQADVGADALFLTKGGKVRKNSLGIASLAKVVARYCGKTLEKPRERTSNWEARLTERQLEYAANDAHSALMAYLRLLEIAKEQERVLTPSGYTRHVDSSVTGVVSEEELEEPDDEEVPSETTPAISAVSRTPSSTSSQSSSTKATNPPTIIPLTHTGMRAQYWRAYRLWHGKNMPMDDLCKTLSVDGPPLKRTTVISYVIGALQADKTLAFDMKKLRELVQMEAKSWSYHKTWIFEAGRAGRGSSAAMASEDHIRGTREAST